MCRSIGVQTMAPRKTPIRVVCLHIPRRGVSDVDAYITSEFDVRQEGTFRFQLEELAECLWEPFSLELYAHSNMVYVTMAGHPEIVDFLITGIYSWMSDVEIHDVEDYAFNVSPTTLVAGSDFRLWRPDTYPLNTYTNFKVDSLAPVVTALSQIPEGDRALVQVIVKPIQVNLWHHLGLWNISQKDRLQRLFRLRRYFKSDMSSDLPKKILEKSARRMFWINYRISSLHEPPANSTTPRATIQQRLINNVQAIANAAKHYNTVEENKLILRPIDTSRAWIKKIQARPLLRPFRAVSEEVSTFWHPPLLTAVPNTAQVLSKHAIAPITLPRDVASPDISPFGHTNYRDREDVFGIKRADRRRHMYVIGKSGSGKSGLLQLLVKSDIERGFGCAVLDPHGDLIDDILRLIPKERINDVVLFDPADPRFAPSFNPMDPVRPELRLRVALSFLDAFKRSFGADWSERMDHVLRYAMLGLLSAPGSNILSLRRMLSDEIFRADIVRRATDESVKRFWLREFAARRQDFEEGPISRLLNRIDELLATETMRNVLGQSANLFNFRDFMDSRKIVLLKISKGGLGSENANLLGSLLIWKIYEAAMSRADIPAEAREDFFFYVDEFQNFATESFTEIMSESRKYNLCLTFANQFLGQLPDTVRKTIFGNISNFIAFRVGADDASVVASELKPHFGPDDLINLPLREFYAKMSIDGQVQDSFSARTIDLEYPPATENYTDDCVVASRQRYCVPLEQARKQASLKGSVPPAAARAGNS